MEQPEIEAKYLNLTPQEIQQELLSILARSVVPKGTRQEPFLPVETLLTYGLFFVMNPHRYGGGNIHTIPPEAAKLAAFFKRTPGSITNKMLNLEGFRPNSAKLEPALFADLGGSPQVYIQLYREILQNARKFSIGKESLPDFLELVSSENQAFASPQKAATGNAVAVPEKDEAEANSLLIGQEELPSSATELLAGKDKAQEVEFIQTNFGLDEILTEKLVEQKVRLAQHRFAKEVLLNYQYSCTFCGFSPPPGIPKTGSGLLRASHIKPWAVSDNKERVDIRNGLAACPIHDVAFDQGYLMVNGGYHIHLSQVLKEGIAANEATSRYFGEGTLQEVLRLSPAAQKPGTAYLQYHRQHIFRGG